MFLRHVTFNKNHAQCLSNFSVVELFSRPALLHKSREGFIS